MVRHLAAGTDQLVERRCKLPLLIHAKEAEENLVTPCGSALGVRDHEDIAVLARNALEAR
jgi:hypothetical protein